MLGCFGDSLIRKFDEAPPPEWVAGISTLNDYQLAQGMRRLVFSGKAHPPTLPEFVKLCRTIGHLDDVADSLPAQQHPAIAAPEIDRWLLAGNRRLERYITTKIPENPLRYGRGASAEGMRTMKAPNADASPEFVSAINTLVAMKNRWVEVMQQSAGPDGVPPDEQNQCWAECMRTAEATIAQERVA